MMSRAKVDDLTAKQRAGARRYVERTYCGRFERRGWVHDDGTLSIDAHVWLVEGGSEECATAAEPGGRSRPVPCEDEGPGPETIECALLHHVPRTEVEEYVAELRRDREVTCDDGTPLGAIGAR